MTGPRAASTIVVAAVLAIVLAAASVDAQEGEPPFSVYGSGLQAGDAVEAFANGKSCGATSADAEGNWILRFTSAAPCAPAEGDVIAFALNGGETDASETFKIGGAPGDIAGGVTLAAAGGGIGGGAVVVGAMAAGALGLAIAGAVVIGSKRRSGATPRQDG